MKKKKVIYLKNSINGETDIYHAPMYTKINSVYGYLIVDIDLVVRFFSEHDGVEMETLDYIEASIVYEDEV